METNKDIRVLLVEDEPDLRELLSSELELNGYNVIAAGGGQEAFKFFSENEIDLVVSDLKMGLGSGMDLLKSIRDNSTAHTPVILMSGYSDFDNKEASSLGAQMLLHKPFSLESFVSAVEEALAKS
ncbi:MAG: response regulator [Bdellovibrionota bacterium]